MWPFKKPDSLMAAGLTRGLTDWHSHILPGVDDGVKTMEDSLALLKTYEDWGIKEIWLTPHVMEDMPNTTDGLRARFAELLEAYKGGIKLNLATEHMMDSLFEERLEANDVLPIGRNGEYLLVETSYFSPPMAMDDIMEQVKAKGYYPLLAHPERYRYMEEKDYLKWKERGVLFQMNFNSMVGGYGETARKKAEWMLRKGMIDVIGSDVHRLASVETMINRPPAKKDDLKLMLDLRDNPRIS